MKRLFILFCSLSCMVVMAQRRTIPSGDMDVDWERYKTYNKRELGVLRSNYFRDTVSIQEMKEAFRKHANEHATGSPYEGWDSVVYCPLGESIVLRSPKNKYPDKQIRNKRTTWFWAGHFSLVSAEGIDSKVQKKLEEATDRKWMDGDFVTLRAPRHYMGYIVSPTPYMEHYEKGMVKGRSGSTNSYADVFCMMAPSGRTLDGEWHHSIVPGTQLLSGLAGIYYPASQYADECSFDILLYPQPSEMRGQTEKGYTIELLSPESPNTVVLSRFATLKSFIERIRPEAFNPYYTTDMRIMPGRYYHVTVNKCGWLIEDYLEKQ